MTRVNPPGVQARWIVLRNSRQIDQRWPRGGYRIGRRPPKSLTRLGEHEGSGRPVSELHGLRPELDFVAREGQLRPDLERVRFPVPLNRSNFPGPFEAFRFPAIGWLTAAPTPNQ